MGFRSFCDGRGGDRDKFCGAIAVKIFLCRSCAFGVFHFWAFAVFYLSGAKGTALLSSRAVDCFVSRRAGPASCWDSAVFGFYSGAGEKRCWFCCACEVFFFVLR